jgi:hypothetical protein
MTTSEKLRNPSLKAADPEHAVDKTKDSQGYIDITLKPHTPLSHPMRPLPRRRIPTHRNHIPHRPIIPPQPPGVGTTPPPIIRHLRLNTNLLRNHNPAVRLLVLMAAGAGTHRQNMLVAGPHGVVADGKRVMVRAGLAARVLLVFDADV